MLPTPVDSSPVGPIASSVRTHDVRTDPPDRLASIESSPYLEEKAPSVSVGPRFPRGGSREAILCFLPQFEDATEGRPLALIAERHLLAGAAVSDHACP